MKQFPFFGIGVAAVIAGLLLILVGNYAKPASTPPHQTAPSLSVATTTNTAPRAASPSTSSTQTTKATPQQSSHASTPTPTQKTQPIATTAAPTQTTSTPSAKISTPVTTTTGSQTSSQGDLSAAATKLRDALVNIVCTTNSTGSLRSISGSGVIIDPKGVILTNAHVAQYFLLKDYPHKDSTRCIVRTGSPAKDAYTAKLMFISPAWIAANPNTVTQSAPTGTGEHDIALLAITGSLTDTPLPASFSYVPLSTSVATQNQPIVIGSYAAQFLTTNEILTSLYPTIVYGNIQHIYTFARTTVDVVSLGGTPAAQEGSSGGGVIDASGKLLATITTSTVNGDTQTRDLHAITETYVERDFRQEMGKTLAAELAEPLQTSIADFAPRLSGLTSILAGAIASQ